MKRWFSSSRSIFLLVLAAAICALLCVAQPVEAEAGYTTGTPGVNREGAFTYSIPIWAPPGPKGLQPNISLTYNSQSGNGYLGVGWSLSGLSSIYRCNQTYAQEGGVVEPVTLTINDVFCLDGNLLRLTSASIGYGEPNSTYQTEIADFSLITAYGTAGAGPAYFVVQDRYGRTLTYGNGGNSQVTGNGAGTALSWQLNEVEDAAGNTMTISYTTASGSAVPSVISWTPTAAGASTYEYTMTFSYGANATTSQGYVAGNSVSNGNLLTTVTIEYAGSVVKTYNLSYQSSATTGRDLLKQVQECADSAKSNCVLPTTVSYQSGAQGVTATATTAVPSGSQTHVQAQYDFDGNGYHDLAYCNGGLTSGTIYVQFGSGSGYGSAVNTGLPCTNVLYGDLTASGVDGILAANGGVWYYYTWNGSSFTGNSTGASVDSTSGWVLADVNGDGLPDLVSGGTAAVSGSSTETTLTLYIRLNTSSGSTPSFASSASAAYSQTYAYFEGFLLLANSPYGPSRSLDFNGDGRQDVLLQTLNRALTCSVTCNYTLSMYEMLPSGSELTPGGGPGQINEGPNISFELPYFLKFNSDACTDLLVGSTVYVSGCDGSLPATANINTGYTVVGVMDWNGDGISDILVQNGSTLAVELGTGSPSGGWLGAPISTSVPYSSSNQYFALDANGDGEPDLGVAVGATSYYANSSSIDYYLHANSGQPPDLVSAVVDGFGNSASPTYVSMVQGVNSTFFPGTDAQYPNKSYLGPRYVTNQVTFSDPSVASGTYQQTHYYARAWMNVQGRGFEGFEAHQWLDSRNGVWTTLQYDLWFPYTGMLIGKVKTENNTPSTTLSQIASTPACVVITGGGVGCAPTGEQWNSRYFPYIQSSTENDYELGASSSSPTRLVTNTSITYGYDLWGNPLSVVTVVTDEDANSPYYGQNWATHVSNTMDTVSGVPCSTLLTQMQVTYTSSYDSSTVTRTRSFTPNATGCNYSQIVTEPGSTKYKVTEALGYDSFGNVNSDTVAGVGMAARLTSKNWGPTGQLPASVTDPTGAVTQYAYDYRFGLPSSKTDPNGVTTYWAYEPFGRLTQETRPDSTFTQWTYSDCGASNGCVFGSHGILDVFGVYNSDGSTETDGSSTTDTVGRVVTSNTRLLQSGAYKRDDTRYDNLGRTVKQAVTCPATSQPCPNWVTTQYDVLNRPVAVQRPISSTNNSLQTTGYGYSGRTVVVTDPYLIATTLVRDVNGRLRRTTDPYGYAVTTGYDAVGTKTNVTDSLSNTLWSGTYAYGTGAFLLTSSDMDLGSWSYTVDALGERTAWTDNKSQSFSASYDALSRPMTRIEPDLFTQWTWGSSAASHNIGQLQSVCTGTGTACNSSGYTESKTYDSLGRLSTRAITIPSAGTYTYTLAYSPTTGYLNTLTYPTSTSGYALQLQYAYQNGNLLSVKDVSDSPSVTVWQASATDPFGHVVQEALGNGIGTTRAYDAVTGWLSSIQSGPTSGSATGVQNLSYLYDEMGDVTQRQDNNAGLTENLYYDNDYRLSTTKLNGTQNLAMTYDETGNITSRSDVAGGATWTYDPVRKHAVTEAGSSAYEYSYDGNGNMAARQGSSIAWSSYNYPTAISAGSGSTAETVAFSYGPSRQRWQQMYSGNGTNETTDYVGKGLEIVSSAGVTDYRHYIYAGGSPVAVYSRKSTGANTLTYVLGDNQGGVGVLANSSGATTLAESFTPFGARRNPATWSGAASNSDLTTAAGITREGYTFQTQLGLWMGLNHMNGRVQDDITGRFLSPDRVVQDPSNTQSYNRYSYALNNPGSFTDPTGFNYQDPNDTGGGGGQAPPNPCTGSLLSCGFSPTYCYGSCNSNGYWNYPGSSGSSDSDGSGGQYTGFVGTTTPSSGTDQSSGSQTDNSDNLATVTVVGSQPPPSPQSQSFTVDPYFAQAFNNALLQAFQPPVCQSIGYMVCLQTTPAKAAAIANAEGRYALFGASIIAPSVGISALTDLLAAEGAVAGADSAANVMNGVRLGQQLSLESANSAFTATGELSEGAIAGSQEIIPAGQLGNPAIPDGFAKFTTDTFASPSGPFQVHFYMNPTIGEVFYGLDYKAIFLGP